MSNLFIKTKKKDDRTMEKDRKKKKEKEKRNFKIVGHSI